MQVNNCCNSKNIAPQTSKRKRKIMFKLKIKCNNLSKTSFFRTTGLQLMKHKFLAKKYIKYTNYNMCMKQATNMVKIK